MDEESPVSPELIAAFEEEFKEALSEAENCLIELEAHPNDIKLLENILRNFHSIKGNAGFLGFNTIEMLAHETESIVQELTKTGTQNLIEQITTFILSVIDDLRKAFKKSPSKPALTKINAKFKDIRSKIQNQATPLPNIETKRPETDQSHDSQEKHHSIRVGTEKLDSLIEMVGELVIAETMVSQSPDIQGLQLPQFEKAMLQMVKICRDIQDICMSLRMVPIENSFRKIPRIVRDTAQKMSRQVNLVITGENTEVDKSIIQLINDPLVHIIRNAIDHGIEDPNEREKKGKKKEGTIELNAAHEAGEVWITIKDDGSGLDKKKILKKAKSQGIITDEETMSDNETYALIFHPGFSTAETVTDISGRGVGMDVVKQNIKKLRGSVDIKSTLNEGTTIVLRFPLTLAIIDGIVVRVGTAKCIIPMANVVKLINPQSVDEVNPMEASVSVKIQDKVVRVIDLNKRFFNRSIEQESENGMLVLVTYDFKLCCLLVNEVLGNQQIVIKGLTELMEQNLSLSGKTCVSGGTILGNGEVGLILDVGKIVC